MAAWLNEREAAAHGGLALRTIEKWVAEKTIRFKRVGRRVLIRPEWVDEAIERHARDGRR